MSYILDALKKSEQQRDHGQIPDVQTMHSSSLNYRNDKKAIWPYILITAIVLNLIAIVYFIIDKDSEKVTTDTENVNTLKQAQTPTPKEETNNITTPVIKTDNKVQIKPSPPTPVQKIRTSNNAETEAKTINPPLIIPKENTQKDIVEYYDLPESLQRQIPTITVSAHIYSSNPLQRSIVINNKFLEEGDYVLDNLILHEITTDGAIFDYDATRFHYGVITGWQ